MNHWSAISSQAALLKLKSTKQGLKISEIKHRLKQYGWNELQEQQAVKWWRILGAQFTNILVLILVIASGISLLLNEYIDAAAIGIILLINATIGFFQEYRAENALQALKKLTTPSATVLRNGVIQSIPARDLVPGDILRLEEGSKIPADARLLEVHQLECNESSLTGESQSTSKQIHPLKKILSLGDMNNMVFMGTLVSRGRAEALVVATGMNTEFGKIAKLVQTEVNGPSPLQIQLKKLSIVLAWVVSIIAVGLFVLSWIVGRDSLEMLMVSLSLAVSVIPEGLPAIITITLAIGVQGLAKKNAIIRRLPAAETLGSVSVICTDKTGTLTKNEMTVKWIYTLKGEHQVTGEGYAPLGEVLGESSTELIETLRAGILCNNAQLIKEGKSWKVLGDPTEACLITSAKKAGLDTEKILQDWPRKQEWTFDSERKRMSTLHKDTLYVKGAPDSILEKCRMPEAMKKKILAQNAVYAQQAHRVLAFAKKHIEKGEEACEEDLEFLGLVAMLDPARPEVKNALALCRSAQIQVIMITGDHALTAAAIGKEIGLFTEKDEILTGQDLESLSETALKKKLDRVKIFARVNPSHKLRILKALQSKGHIVAMTGDGVNDAPALKGADIGIAMGITGTDVAKEASEMVLMDDNFNTIVVAVEKGRVIFRNIKKFIRFLLSANFDEVLLVTILFLSGNPLPFLPLQVLWVNLLTDSLPAIALGNDKAESDVMTLKPRNPKTNLVKELVSYSALAGLFSTSASLWLYFKVLPSGSIEHTRTVMFTAVAIFELLLVFSVRNQNAHFFTGFFKNPFLLMSVLLSFGLQNMVIYTPFFQNIFSTVPLSFSDWALIFGSCGSSIIALELWKKISPKSTHV